MNSAEEKAASPNIASMGPQLYRYGNLPVAKYVQMAVAQLQWGRNFIVAEMRPRRRDASRYHTASMRPQLYRCGNLSAGAVLLYSLGRASMGPQLYRCGNRYPLPGCRPSVHSFNGAATLSLRKFHTSGTAGRTSPCFNGAATLSLRKS